jgi:5-deoxy-glucuronate isomerase
MIRTLITRGTDTDLIGLDLAELAEGEKLEQCGDEESVVVVLHGMVDVDADESPLGLAGSRDSVFHGPGHAVYAPPRTRLRLTARSEVELAIVTTPVGDSLLAPTRPRIIGPRDQRIAAVGKGNWARSVRTILGPEHAAARLLLGETVNPPGNWSSYPPHKHDEQAPPDEVRLEEVYLFKVDPPSGFGVQIRYDAAGEQLFRVRNNDAAAIRTGYHPVVAAPGYALYYLWAMAGEGREVIPRLDPQHAWVLDTE